MPKYTKRKIGEIHQVTKSKTLWEKFTDAFAIGGWILIIFIVLAVVADSA
jgi:hypothetical protein